MGAILIAKYSMMTEKTRSNKRPRYNRISGGQFRILPANIPMADGRYGIKQVFVDLGNLSWGFSLMFVSANISRTLVFSSELNFIF